MSIRLCNTYNSYSTLRSAVRGIKHEKGVVERPNTARGEAECCIEGSRPRPSSALFRVQHVQSVLLLIYCIWAGASGSA